MDIGEIERVGVRELPVWQPQPTPAPGLPQPDAQPQPAETPEERPLAPAQMLSLAHIKTQQLDNSR